MPTLESLMAVVGSRVDSPAVAALIESERLALSAEPDLEEGEPQRHYLSNPAHGYLMQLSNGRIETLFVFLVPTEEYESFDGALTWGLSGESTRSDVLRCLGRPERSGEAQTIAGLGRQGTWDRFMLGGICLHCQYTEPKERLRQLTVMAADIAP
jgi:hypothetical protein